MRVPDTQYTSSGGISIAYQVHGAEQPDLLFAGTTASNIETIWHLPEAARFFERLGAFARVIRFDRRDTGISDPTKEDLTLEAHAEDALAVMDAVGSERPFLLGGIEACRSLAVLAATHPDRVAGLVAICPSAHGSAVSAPEVADEVAAAVADMTWPDSVLDVWAPSLTRDPRTATPGRQLHPHRGDPGAGRASPSPVADEQRRRRAPARADADAGTSARRFAHAGGTPAGVRRSGRGFDLRGDPRGRRLHLRARRRSSCRADRGIRHRHDPAAGHRSGAGDDPVHRSGPFDRAGGRARRSRVDGTPGSTPDRGSGRRSRAMAARSSSRSETGSWRRSRGPRMPCAALPH